MLANLQRTRYLAVFSTALVFALWTNAPASAAPVKKPKLVVGIVVDQFRYDYLTRFRASYTGGLARLLEHGAVFTDAHQIHYPTVTAAGHSTFMSGATPSISGIVENAWFQRDIGKTVTSVSDDTTDLLGGEAGKHGSSPQRMVVSTIGDELKMHDPAAKVIGISIKDRAAILPAGHMADAAYWFDEPARGWVSSTYYMKELPGWVRDINHSDPVKPYDHATWLPLDGKPGAQPFCSMDRDRGKHCSSIEATPWGNEIIESFAERAIAVEQLGRHPGTDLLTVSFSANDYVGHALGPDSPEVRDISIRTDRLLGKFFEYLDSQIGLGNVLIVLTADHGVSPVPEFNQSRRMPGGRLLPAMLIKTMEDALVKAYGEGKWVIAMSGPIPYLNRDLIQNHQLSEAAVENTAANALRAVPHVFRVYTRDDIVNGRMLEDYISHAVRNGFFSQRSGDLFIIPEAYYIFDRPPGTSHGSPYNYDTHVPIMFLGTGIKPGEYDETVAVNDIAPTIANILGVEEPSGSVGRILREILQ